jgi:hypothetical protein
MSTATMRTVTVAPRPLLTRPAAARKPSGPSTARPPVSVRHVVALRPALCQVSVDEPTWQLTRRGLVLVMGLLATVMGSAVVTCLVAFLSLSNSPL